MTLTWALVPAPMLAVWSHILGTWPGIKLQALSEALGLHYGLCPGGRGESPDQGSDSLSVTKAIIIGTTAVGTK